jgi:hypothetical protein
MPRNKVWNFAEVSASSSSGREAPTMPAPA